MEIVPLDDTTEIKEVKILNPARSTVVLKCHCNDSVSTLKENILLSYQLDPSTSAIRLIYNGKLLKDHAILSSVSADEHITLHSSINAKMPEKEAQGSQPLLDHPHYRGFDR